MKDKNVPAYVGKKECGCVIAAVVDDGTDSEAVSRNVAEFVKDGLIVERQTVGYVREHWGCHCNQQESLF